MSDRESLHTRLKRRVLVRVGTVIVLFMIVILETAVIVRDYDTAKEHGGVKPSRTDHHVMIESWMTFNYVNTLFNLPSDYLRAALGITDIRYPNVEIRRYAKETDIDQALLLQDINSAINQYRE